MVVRLPQVTNFCAEDACERGASVVETRPVSVLRTLLD